MAAQFIVGDRVTHNVTGGSGTVVRVCRRWWAFFGWTYSVVWTPGYMPVVYVNGLMPVGEGRK